MRFASVIHDRQPLAVAIDGDRATALLGVTEIGRETPASLLREPPLGSLDFELGALDVGRAHVLRQHGEVAGVVDAVGLQLEVLVLAVEDRRVGTQAVVEPFALQACLVGGEGFNAFVSLSSQR